MASMPLEALSAAQFSKEAINFRNRLQLIQGKPD